MNDSGPPTSPRTPLPADDLNPQVLDDLPVAVYTCDREGLITYFNRAAVELWGREPKLRHDDDRYCGSLRLYLVDGRPIQHDDCWMSRSMAEGRAIYGAEVIIERPNGERVYVRAHVIPMRDAAGNVVGGINVLIDESEMRLTVDVLQRREEHYRLLVDCVQVVLWEADLQTYEYTFVNEYAEQLLGYRRSDWYKQGFWMESIHPEDRAWVDRRCREGIAAGIDQRLEYRMIRADGRVIRVEDFIRVVTTDGVVVGLRGVLTDVTNRPPSSV